MIVTITPNPSLDRTLEIDELARGAVIRASDPRVEAGGKGINVARALLANGHAVRAVVPIGGHEGEHLLALLEEAALEVVPVTLGAQTRTNVTLVEPGGTVTKINAPGPTLSRDEVDRFAKAVEASIDGAAWVAACGSLPPGVADDLYAHLIRTLHDHGVRVAVDTSGDALAAAIQAGPDLVKPNAAELSQLTGRRLATLGDVVDAAETLRHDGVRTVVVSLGPDGAVAVDDDGALHAEPLAVVPRSNVGAGDALLAGYLAAGGRGADALRSGVAFGTAAVQLPGTAMPTPAHLELDAVRLHDLDPDRPLRDPGGAR